MAMMIIVQVLEALAFILDTRWMLIESMTSWLTKNGPLSALSRAHDYFA